MTKFKKEKLCPHYKEYNYCKKIKDACDVREEAMDICGLRRKRKWKKN